MDHARPVNLHRVIRDVVASMDAQLRGIDVVLVLDDQPLFVTVEQRRVEHLLATLLGNAIEAIGTSDGKILVAVHVQHDTRRARVEVSDTGVSATVSPDLVALREIVESYDGQLHAKSTPGVGNEVVFDLPLTTTR